MVGAFAVCRLRIPCVGLAPSKATVRMVEYQAKHRDHLRFVSVSPRPVSMPCPTTASTST